MKSKIQEGSFEEIPSLEEYDIMDLFEELSFFQKWFRVKEGLKQPRDSGAYKWARLQILRLWSPTAAVIIPVLMILLLMIFAGITPSLTTEMRARIIKPETVEIFEKPEPIKDKLPDDLKLPEIESLKVNPGPVSTSVDNASPDANFSPKPEEFNSVADLRSPIIFKDAYRGRDPGHIGSILGTGDGSGGGSEDAVLRALRWLKKVQNSDGSWTASSGGGGEVVWGEGPIASGMTGLALLTFLAHGDTPASAEFGRTVEGAIRYLMKDQKEDGRFKSVDAHEYCHPIASYALCEAYAMTGIPIIRDHAQKAVEVIIKGQHDSGGWDYKIRSSDRDDTSFAAWCAQALKAAQMAELKVDGLDEALKRAIKGFRANINNDGSFAYTNTERDSHKALTAAGLLCLQLLGHDGPEIDNAMKWWDKFQSSDWTDPRNPNPIYSWYYINQAKFHKGGRAWSEWDASFLPTVSRAQTVINKNDSGYTDHKGDPKSIGYWTAASATEYGGSSYVYNTTLSCLMLEVYYRFLPTHTLDGASGKREITTADEIQVKIM